jgi:hypothetical protein
LCLTYVLGGNPGSDWQKAVACLRQIVDEYPDSLYRPPANLILALRLELDRLAADSTARDQRIRQLSTELDRLKKIDADRRGRP